MKTAKQYKEELEILVKSLNLTWSERYDILWKAGMMESCARLETMEEINKIWDLTLNKQTNDNRKNPLEKE